MPWKRLLACITGSVDQELLLRNEYLVTENRILRSQIQGRVRIGDGERRALAEIGKRLGREVLAEVASIVKPETILAWHRRLIARKFDGSKKRRTPGRPRIAPAVEELILRFARENRTWGYDRIAGALSNIGHDVSDETVGNVLERHGIPPAPERKRSTTWKEFIRAHADLLAATDFFTTEVWTKAGLVTYYVLFFLDIATRRVHVAGMTANPDAAWMAQIARNVSMTGDGFLQPGQCLLHDRDSKFTEEFDAILRAAGVSAVKLPAQSPNLNAHAERWVESVKAECLSKVILFGEASLRRRALDQYVAHYHAERNHQGKDNQILFPDPAPGPFECGGDSTIDELEPCNQPICRRAKPAAARRAPHRLVLANGPRPMRESTAALAQASSSSLTAAGGNLSHERRLPHPRNHRTGLPPRSRAAPAARLRRAAQARRSVDGEGGSRTDASGDGARTRGVSAAGGVGARERVPVGRSGPFLRGGRGDHAAHPGRERRRKQGPRRGGGRLQLDLPDVGASTQISPEDLLALDDALSRLAAAAPQKAELVKLRFFAGMTIPQAAAALGISHATAERHWTYAKVWLYSELHGEEATP